MPVDDARANWDLASSKDLVLGDEEPFVTAPLNLLLLMAARATGLEYWGILALQSLLWAATGILLAGLVRRLFGNFLSPQAAGHWGLAALLAWTFLTPDAGFASGRVLGGSVQLFLVVLLWRRHLAWQTHASGKNAALSGCVLGLLCLASPPFVLAIPILVGLVWRQCKAKQGLASLAACLLMIAPITASNVQKSGEFILISAQAGVTFHHGNAPGADGTYQSIPGISASRHFQNYDALRLAQEAGYPGWKKASRYWFLQGLAWWRDEPIAAASTACRKALLFFGEAEYGDTNHPGLERKLLAAPGLGWGGMAAAFFLPGLVGVFFLIRRKAADPLAAVLFLVPLITVLLFFYSPRYRLPALPVALVGTMALVALPTARRWAGALIPTGLILSLVSWTDSAQLEPAFLHKLGALHEQDENLKGAEQRWRQAHEAGLPEAGVSLGHLLRRTGRGEEGFSLLRSAVHNRPDDPFARRALGVAFAESGQPQEAEREFRAALILAPEDWETLSALGGACLAQNRLQEAQSFFTQAIDLRPGFAAAWFNLGLVHSLQGNPEGAARCWREALDLAPGMKAAQRELDALGLEEEVDRSP